MESNLSWIWSGCFTFDFTCLCFFSSFFFSGLWIFPHRNLLLIIVTTSYGITIQWKFIFLLSWRRIHLTQTAGTCNTWGGSWGQQLAIFQRQQLQRSYQGKNSSLLRHRSFEEIGEGQKRSAATSIFAASSLSLFLYSLKNNLRTFDRDECC